MGNRRWKRCCSELGGMFWGNVSHERLGEATDKLVLQEPKYIPSAGCWASHSAQQHYALPLTFLGPLLSDVVPGFHTHCHLLAPCTQSMVCGAGAAAAAARASWEWRFSSLTPGLLSQDLNFKKIPWWFICTLMFEKCWLTRQISCSNWRFPFSTKCG